MILFDSQSTGDCKGVACYILNAKWFCKSAAFPAHSVVRQLQFNQLGLQPSHASQCRSLWKNTRKTEIGAAQNKSLQNTLQIASAEYEHKRGQSIFSSCDLLCVLYRLILSCSYFMRPWEHYACFLMCVTVWQHTIDVDRVTPQGSWDTKKSFALLPTVLNCHSIKCGKTILPVNAADHYTVCTVDNAVVLQLSVMGSIL